jgi:hypothetical protein
MNKQNVYIYTTYVYAYTYMMDYYLAFRRNEVLTYITTWMNLEDIMLSE